MASSSSIPNKRALPTKENALFKSLLQLYESRQYKKAVKAADQILKKFPEHGETTSMKGLVLTNLEKREEGIQLIKDGLKLDLTSHICWHVNGIVQKADRHYEKALTCYARALTYDKDNVNILRDSAQLQLQLRQYDALQDTRAILLRLRPNVRLSWIGLALAYKLNGKLSQARLVLEQYLTTLKGVPKHDVEYSELLMYYVRLLEELGDYNDALSALERHVTRREIVDETAAMAARGSLLEKLDRLPEAGDLWRRLISQSPETKAHIIEWVRTRIPASDRLNPLIGAEALQKLNCLRQEFPQSSAVVRISLEAASGPDFEILIQSYILSGLARGIPSLFTDLKALYVDATKCEAIGTFMLRVTKELAGNAIDPSAYLWAMYYLALHQSYTSPNDQSAALSTIEEAMKHTPCMPELYTAKARILKRAGDSIGAAHALEEARALDLQDRWLNTKCAKYLFRDGQVDQANAVLGLFTKKDASSPGADLEDMQSLFYMLEEGLSYQRSNRPSLALKRYYGLIKTFQDFEDDQFDFHSYCLRKQTLTSYTDLLRFEDTIRTHPSYVAAVLGIAEIYIRVHERPDMAAAALVALGPIKKPKKKAKKIDRKTEVVPQSLDDNRRALATPVKDDDPDGRKLLTVPDPLVQAIELIRPLETLCPQNLAVWYATFDLAIKRGKYLQALRALHGLWTLKADDPELHVRLVTFRCALARAEALDVVVREAATDSLAQLGFSELDLEKHNAEYLQTHPNSAASILAHARCVYELRGQTATAEIEAACFQLENEQFSVDISLASAALDFIRYPLQSSRENDFRLAMSKRFPLSTTFKTEEERNGLRHFYASAEKDSNVGGQDL